MLILSRKVEEGLKIGDTIEIKVLNIYSGDNSSKQSKVASIGIEAPKEISILRKELLETVEANKAAESSVRDASVQNLAGLLRSRRNANQLSDDDSSGS